MLQCAVCTRSKAPQRPPRQTRQTTRQLHSLLIHHLQHLSAAVSDSEDLAFAGTVVPSSLQKDATRFRNLFRLHTFWQAIQVLHELLELDSPLTVYRAAGGCLWSGVPRRGLRCKALICNAAPNAVGELFDAQEERSPVKATMNDIGIMYTT
jgi:hypothetical protein